jgi:hypothetical protein
MNIMNQEQYKLLLSKLRLPVHISYISDYILRVSEEETLKILNELIEKGEVIESDRFKGYYVIKNN